MSDFILLCVRWYSKHPFSGGFIRLGFRSSNSTPMSRVSVLAATAARFSSNLGNAVV